MPLAVVIPAAPDSSWVTQCLASLRPEGPGTIYVVSDGRPLLPEDVVLVEAPPGAGFAERANLGLLRALVDGAQRALLLNDDTEVRPGTLTALAACPARICGAVLEHWEGGIQQAGLTVSRATARVKARTTLPDGPEVDAVSGAAMCLDLGFFEELGGFDVAYHFYFEDVDLCMRARDAGATVELVPAAAVRHRGGGTRAHHSPDAAFHLGRSHALLAKHLGGGPALLLRMLTVAGAGSAWTLRSVGPRGVSAFARGFARGVRAS